MNLEYDGKPPAKSQPLIIMEGVDEEAFHSRNVEELIQKYAGKGISEEEIKRIYAEIRAGFPEKNLNPQLKKQFLPIIVCRLTKDKIREKI